MHIELVSFSATAPGTGAAATAFTGDSLTIKNSRGPARVLAHWGQQQATGYQQIVYPSGHDTTRNWRTVVLANNSVPRNVLGTPWWIQPQELMTITIAGSATAGDVELGHLLLEYDDLPGVNSRLTDWDTLLRRAEKQLTIQVTMNAGATVPGYVATELINADSDLMMANRDYAIVGIETTTRVGALS